MTELRIPGRLASSFAGHPDPRRQHWLASLPGTVAELAARWELDVGEPFESGGSVSWVAPALTAAGERVVLKVGWPHPEARYEAAGLRFWDGNGAVRLYAEYQTDDAVALLLERCEPGTMLASHPEPEQDEVLARTLPGLWREPPPAHEFPTLQQMCAQWAREYEEDPAPSGIDPGIERAGLALFRALPASADRQVLLATDLHALNILAAQRRQWLAIDPKPHIGDPAYDPLQHMLNCERLTTDPAGLARRLAGLLGLDPERLQLWLFARCVQASKGWRDLADVATRLAP